MTSGFHRLAAIFTVSLALISLSACTSKIENTPTHKKATSICLIKSENTPAGSPTKELAANLVEAQVAFGVRAREVVIKDSESVSLRLLKALQDGCVLMASAERSYLDDLATFARGHSKMMVFFVGGTLAQVDQPSNLRWFKDDLALAARLAGFHAAELASEITLLRQPTFENSEELAKAIAEGVREYERVTGENRTLNTESVTSAADLEKNLQVQPQPELVILLAGSSIWKVVPNYPGLDFIGADLQFGQNGLDEPENILGSVERGSRVYLLKAVSALLNRDFANTPPIRSEKSLTSGLVQFRSTADPTQLYLDYQEKLESQQ